jgi:hypothetical protein
MIPALGAEQVLQKLAGFKEYARTGTLLVLELVGTFVSSPSAERRPGVEHRLDLFGVLVVSFVTATAGGITERRWSNVCSCDKCPPRPALRLRDAFPERLNLSEVRDVVIR